MATGIPRLHHLSVCATSLDRTISFYQSLLGFTVVKRYAAVGGPAVAHLRQGDSPFVLELLEAAPPVPAADLIHLGFCARSIPDLEARLLGANGGLRTSRRRVGSENI